MKYYKLLTENEFIGVINSSNFVKRNPINGWLLTSNENRGQFVSYNNQLYRDYWMQPIPNNEISYININIQEITEEEYDSLKEAIDNNEQIIIDDDDDEEPEIIIPPEEPDITVEFVRESKINEMSRACRQTIESGFDLGQEHFSLTTQDQLNLMAVSTLVDTQSIIPYHADGEEYKFYPAEEIKRIIDAAASFKNYHTAYYNALKAYINALDTIEEISAITYGTSIPDEYKSDVLKILE